MNSSNTKLRILHAVPGVSAVDIYAEDVLLKSNLKYGEYTDYLTVEPGRYNIKVFLHGEKNNPVINAFTIIANGTASTAAAVGQPPNTNLTVTLDAVKPMEEGKTMVRFIHFSPNTPAVDITLPDGTILFENVKYRDVTEYLAVDAGNYSLQARPTGTQQVALSIPNISFTGDKYYSIYAVGLLNDSPPLKALQLEDANRG